MRIGQIKFIAVLGSNHSISYVNGSQKFKLNDDFKMQCGSHFRLKSKVFQGSGVKLVLLLFICQISWKCVECKLKSDNKTIITSGSNKSEIVTEMKVQSKIITLADAKKPETEPRVNSKLNKTVEKVTGVKAESGRNEKSTTLDFEVEMKGSTTEAMEPEPDRKEEEESGNSIKISETIMQKEEDSEESKEENRSVKDESEETEYFEEEEGLTPRFKTSTDPYSDSDNIIFIASTPRSLDMKKRKIPYIKKIPSRLVAASNLQVKRHKLSTTLPPKTTPKKKVTRRSTKKPTRATKPPKPRTTTLKEEEEDDYEYEKDPHHPHGVVVFDKRKKPKPRPKPIRRKTTTTTTSTTTEAPEEEPEPEAEPEPDLYDYFLTSGENGIELTANKSGSNATMPRIPLSKLALAMLASSAGFHNGTIDELYYQKTPVNLLNILQAYTKQLEVASTETFKPPVKVENQPLMVHLNQLNFGTKVGISIYYSLIAIIPLVYLAFGGLGRLGLNAFVGRNLGIDIGPGKRRRKRRSFHENYYSNFNPDHFVANTIKRIQLDENEDEYSWIMGRISEVIWELSQLSYEIN